MKIIHLVWTLATGGVETMLVDIINVQVESEDVELIIVNNRYEESLLNNIKERCKVHILNRKEGSKSPLPWIRLNYILWRCHPDIIHFHLEGMRKMVFHPAPKVFTIHNIHTSGKEFAKYSALYAISNAVKEYTHKQGYESIIVYNGVNANLIKTKINTNSPPNVFHIVCVGRLFTPHKGQDILINAIKKVIDNGSENIRLDLIGDGESLEALKQQVQDLTIEEYVSFLGHKSREYLYTHLCDYDLFVLPSRSEGFGLSVAEAVLAKVPVLVTDLDGPMEIIDHGTLGLHFKNEDADDLSDKIISFIEKGINNDLVQIAYDYVLSNYSISTTAKRYIEEYYKVTKNIKRK